MSEYKSEDYKLLSDVPVIEGGRKDDLKFVNTAGVLARAALYTQSPITIGVYGNWGTGKTSLMRLMHQIVDDEGRGEHAAVPVWFNAWQYEREEHLIIPLIATIARDIKKREEQLRKEEKEQNKIVLSGEAKTEVKKIAKKALKSATRAREILETGGGKVHDALRSVLFGLSMKGEFGVPGLSKMEISASMKDVIERYEAITQDAVMARSLYFEAFDKLRELSREKDDDVKKPQIIVFIDDLDRCFPEKAVRLLESIKLVLHLPNFAFVLGVYPEIIQEFIRNKYIMEYPVEAVKCAAEGDASSEIRKRMRKYISYFDEYLDKIVQIYRRMPERKPEQMEVYIKNLVNESGVFSKAQLKAVVPLIAEAGRRNPRSIVRLLNRIIVSLRISKLENPESNIDSLGLLIHEATNEARYAPLLDVIDRSVMLKEAEKSQKIGDLLADQLEEKFKGDHKAWISGLRELKDTLISSRDFWETAISTLADNPCMCNLLKTEKGLLWLRDKDFRENLESAADVSMEKKEFPEKENEIPEGPRDIIMELEESMVKIKGGTFKMGDGKDDDNPVHEVRLDDFMILPTQVTQAQYEAVMGEGKNPSRFKGKNRPVERVTWYDAVEFCKNLNGKSRSGRKYDLPTEAQWEYACRAGSDAAFCFGDDEEKLGDYAWYRENSGGETHPVREKEPNKYGLYDMHGNVWEWCRDWYDKDYYETEEIMVNPTGPSEGSSRVLRGGSWLSLPYLCRSANRYGIDPSYSGLHGGFRVVCVRVPEP